MNHGFREALAPSFAARSGRGRLPDGCWHAVYGATARPRPPKGKGGARTAWNDGKSTSERPFVSSGKFRMNANGRRLDVWLIYKCPACGTTWNMEVVARTPVSELSPGRLRAYESNDPAAARAYACDPRLFAQGQAVPVYDEGLRIKKRREAGEEGLLEIRCPENAALRWTRFSAAGSAYRASRSRRQSGTGTSPEREEPSRPPPGSTGFCGCGSGPVHRAPRAHPKSPHGDTVGAFNVCV